MLGITVLCVGKMKETGFRQAVEEYSRRLRPYCSFQLVELPEQRLPEDPSPAQIAQALEREAGEIEKHIPAGARLVAMCVEGRQRSSEAFSALLDRWMVQGVSRVCFLVGGSFGLDARLKARAEDKLSMSEMTFPHSLARVMLCEQIYRAFMIREGTRYHK